MEQVPQQNTKTADFKSIYSNNVQFTMSPWDVVFMFGENQSVKDNILMVEQSVRVVMSPQHAKVFCQVLTDQIGKYETAFGVIQVPTPPTQPEVKPTKPS
jgi:hypothetical protein